MKVSLVLLLASICVSLCYDLNNHRNNRIIGGSAAKQYQFPYVVDIRYQPPDQINHWASFTFCSGALLSPTWIISIAFCFPYDKEQLLEFIPNYRIVAGMLHLYEYHPDIQIASVTEVVFHPKYDYPHNDLALVKIASAFTITQAVQPVGLPKLDGEPTGTATVVGWGLINEEEPTMTLQYMSMSIITDKECNLIFANDTRKDTYPYIVKDDLFCTLPRPDQTICVGDFGAPLVQDGVLIGNVQGIAESRPLGSPNVFRKVSPFRDFIDKYVTDRTEE